ncbi:MAG: elongation factor P [Patescibacteria group bacterium]
MLSYTELKPGVVIIIDDQPHEIVAASFLRMQQRKAVVQTKLKNLMTGKITDRNMRASDNFEEAEVVRELVKYLYSHRGEFWFSAANDPSGRFSLTEEVIGGAGQFLKTNTEVTAIKFNGKIIGIRLPIKVDLKVTEAPPSDKGDTASGGKKTVTLETGAKVNVPLFIGEGDIIRINTETGEYTERVEKK